MNSKASEYDLKKLIADAVEEFEEVRRDHAGDLWDLATEIADSNVPVYTYELAQWGAHNVNELMLAEPDIGPAFDGAPTPTNIIAANIYEAIYNRLAGLINV